MKMSDIIKEGETLKAIGRNIRSGWDYLTKPTQYASPSAANVDFLTKQIQNREAALAKLDPADKATRKAIELAQAADRASIERNVGNSMGALRKEVDPITQKPTGGIEQRVRTKSVKQGDSTVNTPIYQPGTDPTKYSGGQRVMQGGALTTGGIVSGAATSDEPFRTAVDTMADIRRGVTDVGKAVVGSAVGMIPGTGTDVPTAAAQENDKPKPTNKYDIPSQTTNESVTDILKLSGQRSITERDNIAGIIKPKEIIALHESKQIDECGMMPNTPNTPATLNISATAGSGEEVANMLAAIMNLAGVKPVTGDMLGGAEPPMPIVKAIDIISKGSSDSMNSHDHDHKEPLTGGMEEEYANTPEDPTKVPELDTNKLAYQPNSAEPGDRMDGTMPKGFPTMTKESLYQAYNQFKNGQ